MFELGRTAKSGYVAAVRVSRRLAASVGVSAGPAPPRSRRARHWLRSLAAIHDVDALIALDVPWWTYPATDAVEDFLARRCTARVFEYGSGASTVWLARRASAVVSVEHDSEWFAVLAQRLATLSNVSSRLVPPDPPDSPVVGFGSRKPGYRQHTFSSYVRSIHDCEPPFDVIVIDGRAREACLREARHLLAPDGMIVFDNSGRRRYRAAIRTSGLHETKLRGLVPSLPVPDVTSLLSRGT